MTRLPVPFGRLFCPYCGGFPTHGDCTTYMETCGNGARIGTESTQPTRKPIQRGHDTVAPVFFAGAVLATMPTPAGWQPALASTRSRAPAAPATACGWPWTLSNPWRSWGIWINEPRGGPFTSCRRTRGPRWNRSRSSSEPQPRLSKGCGSPCPRKYGAFESDGGAVQYQRRPGSLVGQGYLGNVGYWYIVVVMILRRTADE